LENVNEASDCFDQSQVKSNKNFEKLFSKAKFEIQKISKNGDPHKHKSIEFQLKPKYI
jgi:hypothetical protein